MTEPAKAGHYPLLVSLHGGIILPSSHANFGYTPWQVANLASAHVVQLYPEYQGYMGSPGPTGGIPVDVANIKDALAIATDFGEVTPDDTYLLGYSLGGGLALMTAGWDHQVRAVVAVSPFVGMHDVVAWVEAHPNTAVSEIERSLGLADWITTHHGTNLSTPWYDHRSPNLHSIQAPVLLLQGTADHHVLWQTVRLFAQQMKADHQTVKLILYPGGHHGLKHAHLAASTGAISAWFNRYGLHFTFNGV